MMTLLQNDEIVAIPGTRKTERLVENLGAFSVQLSAADVATIKENLPAETVGSRY
jgi:aryl-alcohol dehydrogenase-like predicted oxidoreductase